MNARDELIDTLRRTHLTKSETADAHRAYVDADEEANVAFCAYVNHFGMGDALRAYEEVKKS